MAVIDRLRESRDRLAWKANANAARHIHKFVYRYATRRLESADDSGNDVVFLNYGYEEDPPMAVPLSVDDEPDRYSIQLYHRTASQVDLDGKRVLEVGCGHGGGASYITRTLHPASYTGLDLNPAGIEFCRKRHNLAGLTFVQGDAESLPFPDNAFDAVINVESSHLYPGFANFLSEVARVLSPGGHFLYADARPCYEIGPWETALAEAPFAMVSQRVISADVVRGMEKNLEQWQSVIDRVVPGFLRGFARAHSPARSAYEDLRAGGSEYRMYSFTSA